MPKRGGGEGFSSNSPEAPDSIYQTFSLARINKKKNMFIYFSFLLLSLFPHAVTASSLWPTRLHKVEPKCWEQNYKKHLALGAGVQGLFHTPRDPISPPVPHPNTFPYMDPHSSHNESALVVSLALYLAGTNKHFWPFAQWDFTRVKFLNLGSFLEKMVIKPG